MSGSFIRSFKHSVVVCLTCINAKLDGLIIRILNVNYPLCLN